MREFENERAGSPWLNRKRSAAIGFGLGATLALSPFVWAENPPAAGSPPQATQTTPQTMTSPIALIQHQSLAPLVKKVSPAAWRHIHLNGHYTFRGGGQVIDLDAIVAGLDSV